jgi:hypothetical protein
VIERAARARRGLIVLEEDQPRVAEQQTIGRFGQRLAAEIFLVPLHGLRLIGHVQVNVVDDWQNRRLRRDRHSGRAKHDSRNDGSHVSSSRSHRSDRRMARRHSCDDVSSTDERLDATDARHVARSKRPSTESGNGIYHLDDIQAKGASIAPQSIG